MDSNSLADKSELEQGERPWGFYRVIADTHNCKVKYVVVHAGHRLSLQFHKHRAEHWFIVTGEAHVSINGNNSVLNPGQCIDIPKEAIHRMTNKGVSDLIFVEVQTGEYFGEDDIQRIEDDYSRPSH